MKNELIKLIKSQAVSGYEWNLDVAETIQSILEKNGERIGDNLIYTIGEGKKTIFVSAHMDEVGFFISKIEKGFVRIMPIGDIDISDCINKKLVFEKQLTKSLKKAKSFSDLKVYGISNPKLGSVGTFEKKVDFLNDEILGTSLDNKVGCLALIKIFQLLSQEKLDKKIIFCFACREEVGVNGLMTAVKKVNPDMCIDIDSAYALPISSQSKKKNWQIPTIGKGPALQLIGDGFIIRAIDRKFVENIALVNNISFQYEIPDPALGGTNARSLLLNGYDTIQINIPVANQHSAESKASFRDIKQTILLLQKVLIAI